VSFTGLFIGDLQTDVLQSSERAVKFSRAISIYFRLPLYSLLFQYGIFIATYTKQVRHYTCSHRHDTNRWIISHNSGNLFSNREQTAICDISIHGITYLRVRLEYTIYLWLYRSLLSLGRAFQFLDFFTQSVGLLGREISPSQGHYLHTGQHKHRINAHRHPCLKWD
jgi:hypothetical protein